MDHAPKPSTLLGTDEKTGENIILYQSVRPQGVYILGTNGTGKSTLIENMIVVDLAQGLGICLIEPHGDLTKKVLARLPENRIGDVIHIDIANSAYPFGFNL